MGIALNPAFSNILIASFTIIIKKLVIIYQYINLRPIYASMFIANRVDFETVFELMGNTVGVIIDTNR